MAKSRPDSRNRLRGGTMIRRWGRRIAQTRLDWRHISLHAGLRAAHDADYTERPCQVRLASRLAGRLNGSLAATRAWSNATMCRNCFARNICIY